MDTPEKEIKSTKELARELASVVKVPKKQKEKTYTKLFINFIIAIIIFIYFFALNNLYKNVDGEKFEEVIHIISCVLVVSLIIEIEVAYRKDNNALALHGVELFVITMLTLFIPYVFLHRGEAFKFLYSISSMFIAIYYSLKCLIIYEVDMKKYKDNLSDVKEIIKEEEKTSYLDEKSKRKYSNNEPVEEEPKEVIQENDSRMAKLEKMQEKFRNAQEKRRLAKQIKHEKNEKEAIKQKINEKFSPVKEEKLQDVVLEDKIKEENLETLKTEEIIEAEEFTEASVPKKKNKKHKSKRK